MFDSLLALVAPHSCCGCGHVGAILCEHCREDITIDSSTQCIVCERPATQACCRRCAASLPWSGLWCAGQRRDTLKTAIDLYKFERVRAADTALADLLHRTIPQVPADTMVTYVPITSAHRRQRGYDHMARVAARLATQRQLSSGVLLRRTRDVVQRGATRRDRLTRQDGAFAAVPTLHAGPILLIDDIYTTGATLRAATAALREHYKQPIYAAVIARQPSRK